MDEEWFKGSTDYWRNVEATVNGMLGGYATLHTLDIRDSRAVLLRYLPDKDLRKHALDVGAGIGRISKHLLAPLFDHISVMEPDSRFYDKACNSLGDQLSVSTSLNCRVQEYRAADATRRAFDLIWIQWVLIYCSDDALKLFLGECKKSLRDPVRSLIVIKENILSEDRDPDVDLSDHSIVRNRQHFYKIFNEAGLQLIGETTQKGFPSSLYPVRLFVLKIKIDK